MIKHCLLPVIVVANIVLAFTAFGQSGHEENQNAELEIEWSRPQNGGGKSYACVGDQITLSVSGDGGSDPSQPCCAGSTQGNWHLTSTTYDWERSTSATSASIQWTVNSEDDGEIWGAVIYTYTCDVSNETYSLKEYSPTQHITAHDNNTNPPTFVRPASNPVSLGGVRQYNQEFVYGQGYGDGSSVCYYFTGSAGPFTGSDSYNEDGGYVHGDCGSGYNNTRTPAVSSISWSINIPIPELGTFPVAPGGSIADPYESKSCSVAEQDFIISYVQWYNRTPNQWGGPVNGTYSTLYMDCCGGSTPGETGNASSDFAQWLMSQPPSGYGVDHHEQACCETAAH